jgi:6-pyruvoyltetrahydropterin/6-carboxytetrahydropterin synthase
MYYITKRIEISAAHKLKLSYDSKCENLHGHNWIITVYCKAKELDENGMVIDFTHIKQLITEKLDHSIINDVIGDVNPTAENIAYWVYQQIDCCYKVSVQESEGNIATYEED